MKISIIGGGNIGTLMAAEIAMKGHSVTIYTSRPHKWNHRISVVDAEDTLLFESYIENITDNLKMAIETAEVIFITTPSQTFMQLGQDMKKYVHPGQMIGVIPGSGGAEFAFRDLIKKGCVLFGFQRVHSIARLKYYGDCVYMLGRKIEIQIGAIPRNSTKSICIIVESLFDLPCVSLPNYLCVTLTPSNPILHTARIYAMFKDYKEGTFYPKNFLFYEEWDDCSSDVLILCDDELQKLCTRIPLALKDVKSLKEHYESYTISEMTNKISGIPAFRGLLSPMKEVEGGWKPDFDSRYFTADFSFGLKIIKDIGELFKTPTPAINKVWEWYKSVNPTNAIGAFELGDISEAEFIDLYLDCFTVTVTVQPFG